MVIEVACLMEGEWSRGMASLMEGVVLLQRRLV